MLTWIAPIIVFGLVIFVHELGHFVAAKLMGVYAPRFSIGFGPSLWRRRYGETEYVLAAFPLGGYVRMASREDEATAFLEGGSENSAVQPGDRKKDGFDPDAMIPFGPKPIPESRWFETKSLPARLFIMLAGVTMNAVLAYVIYAGLILRSGIPTAIPVAATVLPDRPAAVAGIQAGDSIAFLDGAPLDNWETLFERIGSSPGVPLRLGIVRGGTPVEIVVTPAAEVAPDPRTGIKRRVGRIGVVAKEGFTPVEFSRALGEAWNITLDKGTAIFETLGALFSRGVGVSELGGPIAIAQVSVQAARGGIENLLALTALISINVAVFNLLPIPILDGGQIVLNIAESIKGSAFSMRTRERILKGGLVLIAMLFVTVMFNDISRNMAGIVRMVGRLFGGSA